MSRPRKRPSYMLPHGIEVIGEYPITSKNRYVRARILPHPFFSAPVIGGGQTVRRSRVVMASKLGRALLDSEHVHHLNEDTSDDRPENLELISPEEHNHHHKTGSTHRPESKARISQSLRDAHATGRIARTDLSTRARDAQGRLK